MAVLNYLKFAIAFIDSGIVWLLRTVYSLFYQLTDVMLYSEKIVESLGQRIGLILGIFMLFRLAVSLVNYMISPDKLNDNAKGGGRMLINIIVSLVLLATVNIIFVQAYKIQDVIVKSGFIEKIFFGTKVDTEERQTVDISYYLYTPLFSPNEEVFGDVCNSLWDPETEIKDKGECDAKLYELLGDDRRAVYRAFNTQNMMYVLQNYNVVTARQNNEYAFDYKILAPVAGVMCAIMLVSFSMDLAIRAVKLLFLQIIAPIPIISNIDPAKGQDIFKKWYQECFKTYISVFLRMITIDFAVYIITVLLTEYKELFVSNPFLNVILIVGALMFAKQVPKLIENIFGIKMEGSMALNPLKRFQEQALFGKNITGFAAGAIGGTVGALTGAGLLQPLKGMASGLVRGKGFGETFKTQSADNAKMRNLDKNSSLWGRTIARANNAIGASSAADIYDSKIKSYDKEIEKINKKMEPINEEKAVLDNLGSLKKEMEDRAEKKILDGEFGSRSEEVKNAKNKIDTLTATAAGLKDWVYSQGGNDQDYQNELEKLNKEITQAQIDYKSKMDSAKEDYISQSIAGTGVNDGFIKGKRDDYNELLRRNKDKYESIENKSELDATHGYATLKSQDDAITVDQATLRHKTYQLNAEKAAVESKKRELQNDTKYKKAMADKDAVGGK